jgi:hypothetical protein
LAAGLIATNPSGAGALPVTWDHLGVVPEMGPGAAAAKLEIYPTGSINNSSTARVDSFRIYNNSTGGRTIESVLIDLSTAFMPDMVFDPNGVAGDVAGVPFVPNSGGAATDQSNHEFMVPHDGGFDQLRIDFTDFDEGEVFTFRTDVDPTSVQGSAQPGPSNAADVSGLELTGATITIVFSDGTELIGQVFALVEGATFYKVHSEVVLASAVATPAPQISLVGAATPLIVESAAQTIRITGPAGASVRLLQTEVALHLESVPNGGFDIDPFETNKVVFVRDDVATIGAGGFVDIMVTLKDSLVAGGVNYFVAVIDEPGGRTSLVSNVIKVALNDLPPGSTTEEVNDGPEILNLFATPDQATEGPITITALAVDDLENVVAVEYFIDTVGAEGAGTPMSAADGTFDTASESVAATISAIAFESLSPGIHAVFVRGQDSAGAWGELETIFVEKLAEGAVVLFRVNAGGPALADSPSWDVDTNAQHSSYNNYAPGASNTATTTATTNLSHPSIPAGTPMSMFQSERFDLGGSPNLLWDFPVTPGQYEVRLYFADTYAGTFAVGARVFDVTIEGVIVLDDYDIFADVGGLAGVMKSFIVDSDANLDIDFLRVKQNPLIRGVEILSLGGGQSLMTMSLATTTGALLVESGGDLMTQTRLEPVEPVAVAQNAKAPLEATPARGSEFRTHRLGRKVSPSRASRLTELDERIWADDERSWADGGLVQTGVSKEHFDAALADLSRRPETQWDEL